MYRDNSIVKLKLDVIFKRVFGDENDKDILAAFLSAMLEISRERKFPSAGGEGPQGGEGYR
ncbi:MAG: hypothetical protein IIU00_06750 [Clostridia bacterium]|nr:hypothetical protein [Clostridia bacterium]